MIEFVSTFWKYHSVLLGSVKYTLEREISRQARDWPSRLGVPGPLGPGGAMSHKVAMHTIDLLSQEAIRALKSGGRAKSVSGGLSEV